MPRRFPIILLIILWVSACQPVAAPLPTHSPVAANPKASPASEFITKQVSATGVVIHTATPTVTPEPAQPKASITPLLPSPTPSPAPVTTLLFTGVIVPARCVQAALDQSGNPDYPYEEVKEIISQADIAIGSFNATMSDQVEHTGCVTTYQLVGSPDNADAMARAGFDILSVATNHIKDCGWMRFWCDEAFFDTLSHMRRVGILPVGAGANLSEALEPVVITANGIRFGFVSMGDSKLSESVFASGDQPGIARLTEENMRSAVEKARQMADVVIALPHWGSEDILIPNWIQRGQAQYIVESGADLVVGNHTHVVQAYQVIGGIQVFYGLGNFVFDQGWKDHRQGVILVVRFEGSQFAGYELIPTHVDSDGRVHLAGPQEASEILQRVDAASQTLP